MIEGFKQFRGLTLSILLTGVLVSCGGKKHSNPLVLKYNKNGLIVSSQVDDPTPISAKDTPYVPGERLLQTQWGQGAPFNNALPDINSVSKPPVGCVNTAMAQLMYHFKETSKSRGIVKKDNEWADLNVQTNWDILPVNINSSLQSFQKDEIADLMRKLVIVNRTKLATNEAGGSSTNTDAMVHNLIQYFGFGNNVKRFEATPDNLGNDFINAVLTSIDSHQPVFLSLHGTLNHLVIIDGYKIENDEYLFHLNMGWNGMHDGFYSLKKPIVVTEEFERDGSAWQRVLKADEFIVHTFLKPCTNKCFETLEEGDTQTSPIYSGGFTTNQDIDLRGPFPASSNIRISFDYGRANGYYVALLNDLGELIEETSINATFESERPFYVRVSPVSFLTSTQYLYSGNYKFQVDAVKKEDHPIEVFPFALQLGVQELILKNDNNSILRTSIFPYAPESFYFQAVNKEGDVLENKIQFKNNLLKIIDESFETNKSEEIIIQAIAQSDSRVIAQQELSVLRPANKFYAGKKIELQGEFSSTRDTKNFTVALEGQCQITGSRGYSNQAFYIDVDGIDKSDNAITDQFDFGLYNISTSLFKNYSSYSMEDGFNDFIIKVTCPDASYDITRLESVL